MKSSCINNPPKDKVIMIREWQLEFTDGNECAAALLSFFEYWHNIRLDIAHRAKHEKEVAENHGDNESYINDSLWQFHSADDLEKGVMIFKKDTIRKGLAVLKEKGVILTGKNPNPRYKFDNTNFFLLQVEEINDFLEYRKTESAYTKNRLRETINPHQAAINRQRTPKSSRTIPETTTEITKDTTTEDIKTFLEIEDSQPETLSTINNHSDEIIDVDYTPINVDNQNNNPASQTVDISIQSQLETKITRKDYLQAFYQDAITVWNTYKRPEWISHRSLTNTVKGNLKRFAEYFGDDDLSYLLGCAIQTLAGQKWTNGENLTLANLSSNDKLIGAAEAYQQTGGMSNTEQMYHSIVDALEKKYGGNE